MLLSLFSHLLISVSLDSQWKNGDEAEVLRIRINFSKKGIFEKFCAHEITKYYVATAPLTYLTKLYS